MADRAHALGIPAEVLDPKQIAALDPGMRMEVAGAVYFPKDCYLVPSRFMASLETQLKQRGAEFSWETSVTGWKVEGEHIKAVRTNRGELSADEFVLAAGAWSSEIMRGLGLKLPMQAGKGYSLTLPKPRQLPRICAVLAEARVAVTPMDGRLRFGGTMEIAGLNEEINPRRVRGIIASIPQYYPEFKAEDFDGIHPWRGLRPCSPDGLPYLGRARRFSNLIIATGHAMMGISLGPITGRLVSEMVSGDTPSLEIGLLDPDRYI